MINRVTSRAIILMAVLLPAVLSQPASDLNRVTRLGESVFRVETESGHGSGFLIEVERGIIATNHHVVRMGTSISRHNAVVLKDALGTEKRVEAVVVAYDSRKDLALLSVHPSHLAGRTPIEVPRGVPLRPLDRVVAIGSPLSLDQQFTAGRISSVRADSGTGDFLLQPGNSGGPVVLEDTGALVGIGTFGVGRTAGFVRVEPLLELVRSLPRPLERTSSPRELPQFTIPGPYPVEKLIDQVWRVYGSPESKPQKGEEERAWKISDGGSFRNAYEGNNFNVYIMTPVVAAFEEMADNLKQIENRRRRRGNRIEKRTGDDSYGEDLVFYDWHETAIRNEVGLANAITIMVRPKVGETGGSIAKQIAAAAMSGMVEGATGVPTYLGSTRNFKFKGEFHSMRVYSDDRELVPIRRKRLLLEAGMQNRLVEMRDEAYSGVYQYDLADFMEGDKFVIEIFDAKNPLEVHHRKEISGRSRIMRQARADYRILKRDTPLRTRP